MTSEGLWVADTALEEADAEPPLADAPTGANWQNPTSNIPEHVCTVKEVEWKSRYLLWCSEASQQQSGVSLAGPSHLAAVTAPPERGLPPRPGRPTGTPATGCNVL